MNRLEVGKVSPSTLCIRIDHTPSWSERKTIRSTISNIVSCQCQFTQPLKASKSTTQEQVWNNGHETKSLVEVELDEPLAPGLTQRDIIFMLRQWKSRVKVLETLLSTRKRYDRLNRLLDEWNQSQANQQNHSTRRNNIRRRSIFCSNRAKAATKNADTNKEEQPLEINQEKNNQNEPVMGGETTKKRNESNSAMDVETLKRKILRQIQELSTTEQNRSEDEEEEAQEESEEDAESEKESEASDEEDGQKEEKQEHDAHKEEEVTSDVSDSEVDDDEDNDTDQEEEEEEKEQDQPHALATSIEEEEEDADDEEEEEESEESAHAKVHPCSSSNPSATRGVDGAGSETSYDTLVRLLRLNK